MKRPLATAFLIFLAPAALWSEEADAVLGQWRTEPTEHGFARIEIVAEDGLYHGSVVWLSEPDFPPGDEMAGQPKVDRLNPDPGHRGRPILGLRIVEGFRYAGGSRWTKGRIYDPETGNTYKCKMELNGDGELRVRGYVGVPLLGRTTVWERPAED